MEICFGYNFFMDIAMPLVSFATVIRVVTQRFSPTKGEVLRDDPKNGCEGDYITSVLIFFFWLQP